MTEPFEQDTGDPPRNGPPISRPGYSPNEIDYTERAEARQEVLLPNPGQAFEYARRGWPVIPIWWVEEVDGRYRCGCGNPLCEAPGKHPLAALGRGLAGASTSPDQVREWWRRWPRANVAVATGERSGIVAIDCDVRDEHDGLVEFMQWCAGYGIDLPHTLTMETGSGGRHVLLRHPPDVKIRNVTSWLEHVDVKSSGGYIVAPPSLHATGRVYRWLSAPGTPVAEMPQGLVTALLTARSRPGTGAQGEQPVYDYRTAVREGPRAGHRDHFFNARAFELRKAGVELDDAVKDLRRLFDVTEQSPGDPFGWDTVLAKVKRVWDEVEPDPELPEWPREMDEGEDREFKHRVRQRAYELRVQEEARDLVRREREGRRGPLAVTGVEELLARPEPSWLVDGLFPQVGTFQLFGQRSRGKSFLVQDLLFSVAAGHPWLDHFQVNRSGAALYVVGEGGWDLGKRTRGWLDERAVRPERFLAIIEQGIDLRSRDDTNELITLCGEREVVVAVFDTWAAHMPDGDENTARDAGAVIANLKRIATEIEGLVGTVHHTGHKEQERARGWSGMGAAWDTEFSFDRHVLHHTKNRYGPLHPMIGVELVEAGGTLVPRHVDVLAARSEERREDLERLLEVITRMPDENWTAQRNEFRGNPGRAAKLRDELVEDGRVVKKGRKWYVSEKEGGRWEPGVL